MSENDPEVTEEPTEEEKYDQQQEHNSSHTHGGVVQLGEFDVEQQEADREEADQENEEGAIYNENDPALPTLDKDNIPEDDEDDRNTEEE